MRSSKPKSITFLGITFVPESTFDADLHGRLVIADSAPTDRHPERFKLVRLSGGFGCEPSKMGTKVFGDYITPEFKEDPQYSGRRSDVECVIPVDQEQAVIAAAQADETPIRPLDLTEIAYLAIGDNCWGKGKTQKEALQQLKIAAGRMPKPRAIVKTHPEAFVTEMGAISRPQGSTYEVIENGFE